MDNSELLLEINNWQLEIAKIDFNDKLIELAFFKIFVKFEKYMSKIFIHYSIGKKSSKKYKPKRKLGFSTENQLNDMIRGSNRNYVDFSKTIALISFHIFQEGNDPFSLIFSDPNFSDNYKKMQYIRNFIAHESEESRQKYINNVLNTYNIQNFIPVFEFLLRKNKKGDSYFSLYLDIIQSYSEILINPSPYLP